MKTSPNIIHIKLNSQNLGRLTTASDGLCVFEYDADWIKNGFSISPFFLPLKTGVFKAKRDPFDGLFGVFADSMPDGWGNLLLDRFLKSKSIELSSLAPIDRLSFIGNSGMGALSYFPDKSFVYKQKIEDLDKIATQVADILSERADLPTVTSLLEQTGSSGGARPKVLINHQGSQWLVKFGASTDAPDIGKQEFFYSQLAKQCGIEMPETKLFENKYFGTQLFDRDTNQRFHVHSASGLLHASHRYPSLDYFQLAQATMALTKSVIEVEKLLKIMVFNVAIENKDDHAKNFSFIYNDGLWKLSPAYDILKSDGLGGEHNTSVAGAGKPNRNNMMKLAEKIKFPHKQMKTIIDNIFDICLTSSIGSALRKRNL